MGWMGWDWVGSLCGATIRASLRDANKKIFCPIISPIYQQHRQGACLAAAHFGKSGARQMPDLCPGQDNRRSDWLAIREAPAKIYICSFGHCPFGGGSKPLPGWFVAPIFRRNVLVQTGICMILPENRCHRVPV